jgi:cytochrome c-type biogenesis protein CcmE
VRYNGAMRWLACVAIVWLACDSHDVKPRVLRTKHVDELQERDRGELIRLEGRVSNASSRGHFAVPHVRFTLTSGPRSVTVVDKDVVPEVFRDGVDVKVTGRWVRTADVRDGLDKEGFTDVRDPDVFLAREVSVDPITFQF